VLTTKRNKMKYLINKVCVTYRIMFINSRCNKKKATWKREATTVL